MSYNLKVMKMTSMIAVAFLLFLCSTTRCWSLISDFSKNKSDNIWQLGSAVMARSSVFNVFFTKRNIAHLWNPILGALFLVIHWDPEKALLTVSQFSKLESDQGQIWARLDVYSTRDAWHFPPGSRRSNYVKIYSALSLFSDLIGRQFANVFQLGRSTRTKHTDLKSTTNKYSYKC